MGYRSTFVTTITGCDYPEWFREKYRDTLVFSDLGIVSTKVSIKIHDNEIFEDMQKAQKEVGGLDDGVVYAVNVISEDYIVSNVYITKDEIEYFWHLSPEKAECVWMGGLS